MRAIFCRLVLSLLLFAFVPREAEAVRLRQAPWYNPSDFSAPVTSPFPPDAGFDSDYTADSTGMLSEMERMLAVPCGEHRPEWEPLVTKALLAWPLMERGNRVEPLCRPDQGIYTTYLKRYCLRRLNRSPQITAPAGMIAVDTHVHTCYSPDSMADISQMLLAAACRGLSGVAITDHNAFEGAQQAVEIAARLVREKKLPETFFVIPGEEVSSTDGHIIALFLTHIVPSGRSAKETVDAIHQQGGLAIAAHPFLESNIHKLVNSLPFDAVETHNADEELHFARAKSAAQKRRADFYATVTKPQIGASDAHDPQALGACYTLVDCAPDPEAVRQAILAGHTIAVRSFSDAQLRATTDHGLPRAMVALDSVKDAGFWLHRHLGNLNLSLFPHPGLQWSTAF